MYPHASSRRLSPPVGACFAPVVLLALLSAGACGRDLDSLAPAAFPTESAIFDDSYSAVSFEAFGGSKVDAVSIDASTRYRGSAALRVTVPAAGDASGGYAGGHSWPVFRATLPDTTR